MITYLITFLCLVVELTFLPLRYLLGSKNTTTRALLDDSTPDLDSSSSSCASSRSSLASRAIPDRGEDEEDDCGRHHSRFVVEQVSRALQQQAKSRVLEFHNFVDGAKNAQDTIGLMDLLRRTPHNNTTIKALHFSDTVDAKTYRRWGFKRTGLYKHVIEQANIPVSFSATLVLDASRMPVPGMLSLLETEVPKDADIKSLVVRGCVPHQQAEAVALALVSLLQSEDQKKRAWQSVEWSVRVDSRSREAQMVHKVCQRALAKAAKERYIELKLL